MKRVQYDRYEGPDVLSPTSSAGKPVITTD